MIPMAHCPNSGPSAFNRRDYLGDSRIMQGRAGKPQTIPCRNAVEARHEGTAKDDRVDRQQPRFPGWIQPSRPLGSDGFLAVLKKLVDEVSMAGE